MKHKKYKEPHTLELKLKNGRSKTFANGYDMWKWAVSNDKRMEFKFDEKSGPFLSDFFYRRNPNK